MTEQEARAEAEAWLKRLDGDSHWARFPEQRERIDHERTILSSLLAAPGRNPKCEHGIALSDLCSYAETITNEPERVVAAPSDTDREALARIAKRVIDVEVKYDDDDWHRFADAALAEGFRRSPVPPETDETYIAWAAQEANREQARVFVTGLEGDFPSGWREGFEAGLLHRALAAVPPVTEEAWSQPVLEHLAPSLSWWAGRVTDGPLSVEESAVLSGLLLDARNATATEEPEWEYGTRHLGQERVYFESYARKRADELGEHLIRRRKAGPWEVVSEHD